MIKLGDLMKPKPIISQKTNKKETKTERDDPLLTDSVRVSSEIPE